MEVRGFNRVELIVPEDQMEAAVAQFNEVLGTRLPAPHPIAGQPVLSATDFDGAIELVSALDGQGPFAGRPAGSIGPLVWEVASIDEARTWLAAHDYRITFEYDSGQGNDAEAGTGVRQLVLDPAQWFGFLVTLMERDAGSAG